MDAPPPSARAAAGPPAARAAVRVSWTPGRAAPSHRSEMVTSWLLGESLGILDRSDGWARCRGADGYEAWTREGALATADAGWDGRATLFCLGAVLSIRGEDASATPGETLAAPWGSRLVPRAEGVVLPDGRQALVHSGEGVVTPDERARRFPPEPRACAATALRWLGAPYLWGGRAPGGVDCSGFVQAVWATHGLALPRDSRDQARLGIVVGSASGSPSPEAARRGDLLFFAWDGAEVSHVGIGLGDGRIVHASETRGGVAVDAVGGDDTFGCRLAEGLVAIRRTMA